MAHKNPDVSLIAAFITIAFAALIPRSAGVAAQTVTARADLPLFLVNESESGDLNGDGDAVDSVLHVFDAKRRTALNLGLAAATVCRTIASPPFLTCTPVSPVIGKTVAAYLVGESAQGETDLNGDGDAGDDVLYVYDEATGATTNTRLAVGHGTGRDVSSYTFPIEPVVAADGIALLIGEVEQGGTDLNVDGDTRDDVLHVIEPKSREILNVELAAATILGPFGARNPIPLHVDGKKVIFVAGEVEQGGVDLDGDGDVGDQVTYVFSPQNGKLRLSK